MGLAQIASFGLQRALNTLVGAGGVILLGITALTIFATASKKVKEEIQPLNESLETLGQRYLKMQELGIIATATQISIRNKIADLNKEIEELNKTTDLNAIGLEKMGLANLSAADQEQLFGGVTQKLTERIEKIKTELASWQKLLDDFTTDKAEKELDELIKKMNAVPFELKAPQRDEEAATRAMEKLKKASQENLKVLQDDIDTLSKFMDAIHAKRLAQEEQIRQKLQQQAQNVGQYFGDMFEEIYRTGKFSWDKLIKEMELRLLKSIIIKIFEKLFSRGGTDLGEIAGLFGFQSGTAFVPQTGAYLLHKGEAVIPAESNPFVNQTTNNWGGNTYIINLNARFDERSVRNNLLPILRRLGQERAMGF